ncbi:hypothetical protein CYMTET_6327 [Cymbomonas tetramitiformis]|uniref:Uncharacterized protein n=1 Tax=Cymbomonas tetramitiformis TaxID=36881 RepID=A0AAE0GXE2_9CHLO|nr:hypothetical protein CYMTET_6327 [Cymbomonas tetramitiformis]
MDLIYRAHLHVSREPTERWDWMGRGWRGLSAVAGQARAALRRSKELAAVLEQMPISAAGVNSNAPYPESPAAPLDATFASSHASDAPQSTTEPPNLPAKLEGRGGTSANEQAEMPVVDVACGGTDEAGLDGASTWKQLEARAQELKSEAVRLRRDGDDVAARNALRESKILRAQSEALRAQQLGPDMGTVAGGASSLEPPQATPSLLEAPDPSPAPSALLEAGMQDGPHVSTTEETTEASADLASLEPVEMPAMPDAAPVTGGYPRVTHDQSKPIKTVEELEAEAGAMKLQAMELKREGKMAEAREALRKSMLLRQQAEEIAFCGDLMA